MESGIASALVQEQQIRPSEGLLQRQRRLAAATAIEARVVDSDRALHPPHGAADIRRERNCAPIRGGGIPELEAAAPAVEPHDPQRNDWRWLVLVLVLVRC